MEETPQIYNSNPSSKNNRYIGISKWNLLLLIVVILSCIGIFILLSSSVFTKRSNKAAIFVEGDSYQGIWQSTPPTYPITSKITIGKRNGNIIAVHYEWNDTKQGGYKDINMVYLPDGSLSSKGNKSSLTFTNIGQGTVLGVYKPGNKRWTTIMTIQP